MSSLNKAAWWVKLLPGGQAASRHKVGRGYLMPSGAGEQSEQVNTPCPFPPAL